MDTKSLSEIKESHIPVVDNRAEQEQQDYIDDAKRKSKLKSVQHKVKVFFTIFSVIIVCIIILVRVTHLLIPKNLDWLTDEQIKRLDELFVDGGAATLLVGFFKSIIGTKPE